MLAANRSADGEHGLIQITGNGFEAFSILRSRSGKKRAEMNLTGRRVRIQCGGDLVFLKHLLCVNQKVVKRFRRSAPRA